ncbi:MAG: hypothetical protein ACX930_07915 [Erythrobacter sp.]
MCDATCELSREQRKSTKDADRSRKRLACFGLDWKEIGALT